MKYLYDPITHDPLGSFRGAGRIIQTLKEQSSDISGMSFISSLSDVTMKDELIIPTFNPFTKPLLMRRIAKKQSIIIFDVIPIKYPKHFPIGIKGWINLQLNRYALRFFDEIITISHASKKDIINYLKIPDNKIVVKYPTLAKIFRKKIPCSKISDLDIRNSNFTLYVGDVNWNKNLVNLAKAVKIAQIHCVFVGKMFNKQLISTYLDKYRSTPSHHPWLSEYINFLNETKDNTLFHFIGYIPDNELIQYYQKAKANILISRDEGYGYSYAEAKSQGCPSILSDIPVFREVAKNDKNVQFVNPENPEDIAKAIKNIGF